VAGGSLSIVRPEKPIYAPADLMNNLYTELFKQIASNKTIEGLATHDIMVISLAGSIVAAAIFIAVMIACTAHHRRDWECEYRSHEIHVPK
jgi:hypothetical protein